LDGIGGSGIRSIEELGVSSSTAAEVGVRDGTELRVGAELNPARDNEVPILGVAGCAEFLVKDLRVVALDAGERVCVDGDVMKPKLEGEAGTPLFVWI
jgi:hypothetical protein